MAKPVILGILFSISVILGFKSDFLAKPLVSESLIFFSKSDLSASYVVFKANPVVSVLFTSIFLTTSFLPHCLA